MDIENLIDDLDELVVIARKDENIGVSKWLQLNGSVADVKELLEKELNDKWIPVSERLPSDEEINKLNYSHPNHRKFLCTIQIADYKPQVRLLYFGEYGWLYEGQEYNEYVKAWKPLSEPYRRND